MKLKLDLHTHCWEATEDSIPSIDTVAKIVAKIKARRLDGIAITEHLDEAYGYRVKEVVDRHFGAEVLIIPGRERSIWPAEIIELFLPNNSIFRFLAHPSPRDIDQCLEGLHGVEIENHEHDWQMDRQKIKDFAQRYNLFLLSNSDAHSLDDIGQYHNEVSLGELYARAESC